MYDNFQALVGSFGHQNAGCDVCAANLVRFWCYFTCSPDQDTFMWPGPQSNKTDPVSKEVYLVLNLNITINPDLACEVFESCKSVPIVTEIPSAGSSLGIFSFLGTSGESQGHVYVNVSLAETGLNFSTPPYPCTEQFDGHDQFGYEIDQNCSCSSCNQLCSAYMPGTYGELLEGSSIPTVLIVYIAIILLTIVFVIFKKQTKKIPSGNVSESIASSRTTSRLLERHD